MALPSSTFVEMVSTTLRHHAHEVTDNVSDNNALLTWMKKKGNIKTVSGGYELTFPVDYQENSTYQRYSGYEDLNVDASDVITSVTYPWSQIALHVTASGRELRMNNSEEKMIDLVKARIANAKRTAANNMSVDIYSDGTLDNQINGLLNILQVDGQGTVGGIVSNTWSFWRNKFTETGTPSATTIIGDMNLLWLQCVRGVDKPDLIVSSHDFYNFYESALQANQRYASSESASAGFESLKYKTANVIFDDNSNFGTTTEDMYFLNTDYFYLVQHRDAQWSQEERKTPINQDAVVIPLYWMGQLVCTNRGVQGRLFD